MVKGLIEEIYKFIYKSLFKDSIKAISTSLGHKVLTFLVFFNWGF